MSAGTWLRLAAVAVGVCACQSGAGPSEPGPEPGHAATPSKTTKRYGDRIAPGPQTQLASVLTKPADYNGHAVTVEGDVRRACTKRGCWMEIATGMDEQKPGCRVRFKNYGFFIPLDSAGAHARVQGVVQVRQVAAPIVSHLESEGAHFANKHADGTADEVQMVASAVELTR